MFLSMFFPLENFALVKNPGMPADPEMYFEVARRYWPFVLVSFADQFDRFKGVNGSLNPGAPYGNVVRIHLLIFVFAGLVAIKAPPLASYCAVLLFFAPIGKKKNLAEAKRSDGLTES